MTQNIGAVGGGGMCAFREEPQVSSAVNRHLACAHNSALEVPRSNAPERRSAATVAQAQAALYWQVCESVFGASLQGLLAVAGDPRHGQQADAQHLLELGRVLGLLGTSTGDPLLGKLTDLADKLLADRDGKVKIATQRVTRSGPYKSAQLIASALNARIAANPEHAFAKFDAVLDPLLARGIVQGLENRLEATLTEASRAEVRAAGHGSTPATAMASQQAHSARAGGGVSGATDYIDARLGPLDLYMNAKVASEPAGPTEFPAEVEPAQSQIPVDRPATTSNVNTTIVHPASISLTAPQASESGHQSLTQALEIIDRLVSHLTQENTRLNDRLLRIRDSREVGVVDEPVPTIAKPGLLPLAVPVAGSSGRGQATAALPLALSSVSRSHVQQLRERFETAQGLPSPTAAVPRAAAPATPALPADFAPSTRYRVVPDNATALPPRLSRERTEPARMHWEGIAMMIQTDLIDSDIERLKKEIRLGWLPMDPPSASDASANERRTPSMRLLYLDILIAQPRILQQVNGLLRLLSEAGLHGVTADTARELGAALAERAQTRPLRGGVANA